MKAVAIRPDGNLVEIAGKIGVAGGAQKVTEDAA
jgi:hypothetical protein